MARYQGLTPEQRKQQYMSDHVILKKGRLTQIAFLGSTLKLRMGVTTIGGCTGRGKSTANANILAYFFKQYPDRQAMVITNEEVSADVLDRVACVLTGKDFYRYRDGKLSEEIEQSIMKTARMVMSRIEVVASKEVDMTCLEDVIDVLNYAAGRVDINLILVDYLQTVTWSRKIPELSQYEVSKRLGLFLKEYGRQVSIPVVIFAQLQEFTPTKDNTKPPDFASRIQGDKTFVNHSVMAIEIIPNFKMLTTEFYVHKDRFSSMQGTSLLFNWDHGILCES